MKKVFISDLDDVLLDMCSGLIDAFKNEYELYVPKEKWTHFDFRQYSELSKEQILNAHLKYNLINSLDVLDGAFQFLDQLKNSDVDVIIVTSRSWKNDAKELTSQYLNEKRLHVSDVIVSDYKHTKGDIIKDIVRNNNVIGFVDDNAPNALSAIEHVENIYLMDQPWNKFLKNKNLIRVENLNEIIIDLKSKKII